MFRDGSKKDLTAAIKPPKSKDRVFDSHGAGSKVYKASTDSKVSPEERCKSVILKNKKDGSVQLHMDINKRKDSSKDAQGRGGQSSLQFKRSTRELDHADLSSQLPKRGK